ncbi:MAG: ASCH domain-containing protein [Propionibacteriaceae bacterium]|jgi:uncharacterized protein YhfF|nr:ASCH domain-containing protein [Propionibacteriaceae bacterium]
MDDAEHQAKEIDLFWAQARRMTKMETLPGWMPRYWSEVVAPPAWSFGDTPQMADELLGLVLEGKKTATCGLLSDYEEEHEPLPEVGDLSIILDGQGRPRALVRNYYVAMLPFKDVDAEQAYLEGEGDRTLDYWRKAHEEYFTACLAEAGKTFTEDVEVVEERFEVLYPKD